MNTKNFHVIEAKFLGATNTTGARIKLSSFRFEQSVILSWNYEFDHILDYAETYLKGRGFNIVGHGETKAGFVITTDTFEPIK